MQIHDESQHTLRDLVNARGNVFACTNEFADWEPDLVTVAPGSA
jgi:hypothetical protein